MRLAIQAPLIPISASTKGTTQHTDAPIAASEAAKTAGRDLVGRVAMAVMLISVPRYGVKYIPMNTMTISRLADSAGVHVETVRYYQRRGLLREPSRPMGGIRRYDATDVSRLQFIRRAQAMGFTLEEVASLVQLDGQGACEHTRQLTDLKLAEVRRKITELRRLERELAQVAAECAKTPSNAHCPTLDRLESTPARSNGAASKAPSPIRR